MVTPRFRVGVGAVALVATFAVLWVLFVPSAKPATPIDGFDPGMLIADQHFYANTRMNADQVQAFLDREGRNCVPGPDGTPCLKDYRADVPTMAASQYCAAVSGGSQWRASSIIANLARACGINPQVILVMLQKEQSLVYASGAMLNRDRYAKSLGSGCPDFQPCDPDSAGFVMQVYSAGERFQKYRQHPERYNYRVGSNQILYHPAGQCGSATVNIRNQATAALYIYTPYVPNAPLIASGGTQTDACSVSGNLNFYRYLRQWFPESASTSAAPPIQPSPGSFTIPLTSNYLGDLHDVSGDGVIDLVAERAGRASMISPNRRTSLPAITWSPAVQVGHRWSRTGTVPAGDANRDGHSDLYLRDSAGRLFFYPGAGAGFGTRHQVGHGWHTLTWFEGGVDLTGDGRPDVLGRHGDGTMWLYRGDGKGGFSGQTQVGHAWNVFRDLAVVPQGHGGSAAVVGINRSEQLVSYPISSGRFGASRIVGSGWAGLTVEGLADVTGDARGDLLATNSAGAVRFYSGTATGYTGGQHVATELVNHKVLASQRAGSSNHVWSVDQTGRLWRREFIWQAGYHLPAADTGVAVPTGALVVAPGDWDGDGRPDLVWRHSDGRLFLHRGVAGGGLSPTRQQIGTGWQHFDQIIAAGDWLGSGRPGLLAFRQSTGTLTLYPGNGRGGFAAAKVLSTRLAWADHVVNAGRWDAGGRPDLLARRASDGALVLLPGSGGTPMGYHSRVVGTGWGGMRTIVGGADHDGDGRPDLVTVDAEGGVRIYRGNGTGGFAGSTTVGSAAVAPWN